MSRSKCTATCQYCRGMGNYRKAVYVPPTVTASPRGPGAAIATQPVEFRYVDEACPAARADHDANCAKFFAVYSMLRTIHGDRARIAADLFYASYAPTDGEADPRKHADMGRTASSQAAESLPAL
jgi:hypothetical protein